jgi:hypothetical protein
MVSTPALFLIMFEGNIHSFRQIFLDRTEHLKITQPLWYGDSIGHWEGETLVVDTTNYRPRAFQSVSSAKLHIIERFTRKDENTLRYEITVNDPDTYTKPWTLMIPLQHSSKPVYEYACHEGNYSMFGILAGARADEAKKPSPK